MDEEEIELEPIDTEDDPTPIGPPVAPTEPGETELDPSDEDPEELDDSGPLHLRQGSLVTPGEGAELPDDLYLDGIPPTNEEWSSIRQDSPLEYLFTPESESQEIAQMTADDLIVEELGSVASSPGIRHYEVQSRTHSGEEWKTIATVDPSYQTLEVSDLPVGQTWEFRVRAVFGNGEFSAWSAPSPVIFPQDMVAPGIPSKPTATGNHAGITIGWDGMDENGGLMPADFARVVIWDSPDGSPGTWTRRTSIVGPGEHLVTGYNAKVPVWFALTAMDNAGNESGMSEPVVSSRISLVDLDELKEKLDSLEQTDADLSEAQQQAIDDLHELNDKLDNLEEFDPSDLESALTNLQQELSEVADGVGPGFTELRNALDAIEIPDVSHFATQGEVTAAQAAAEAAAQAHADLVASGAKSEAIAAAQAAAQAAQAAAEATANAYTDAQRQAAINSAAQDAQARADAALADAEQAIERAIALSENPVPNPSFEEGAKGWILPNDGRIAPSTVAYHGDRVLRMDTTGSLVSTQSAHRVPVSPGDRYRLSVNVRAQTVQITNGYVYIVAVRHRPDGTSSVQTVARLGADHSSITLPWSNQWQTLSGDITIPEGFTAISFGVRVHNSATPGYYVDFDMASMANITPAKEALDAAAEAQSRADAAHSLAGTAQSNAQSALTMAGSKSKVTYSTSAPSGTASVGDTHRQRNSSGDIIGEWEYTSSGWRKREISSESISNLDVGKLTAGSIVTPEATIRKLLADGITANTVTTARSIVAAPNPIPSPLDENARDFFPTGFGLNFTDPSVWIQGTRTLTTGRFWLEKGSTHRFEVDVRGEGAGTRYYVQLYTDDGGSATGTVVNGTANTYLVSNAVAGTSPNWTTSPESVFTVPATGYYRLRVFGNHGNGTSGSSTHQWFRGMSIRNMAEGKLIVDGSVKTRSLDAQEVAAGLGSFMRIEVKDLVATTGQLGSAVVNRLFSDIFATNKLTASQITVAPGNLWGDPSFDGQIVANWTKTTWGGVPAITGLGTGSQTGGYSAVNAIDVLPGDEIYVSAVMGATGSGAVGETRVYGRMVTPDGATSSISMICSQTTTGTATRTGTYKVPNSIPTGAKLQLGFFRQGTTPSTRRWYIREIKAWRKAQATTIADGAIKTAHIENTGEIVTDGLSANIIKGNHIDGDTFAGNTFSGGLFEGATFQGGLLQTDSHTSRGVKINSAQGIRIFDNSGNLTAQLKGSDNSIKGIFRASPDSSAGTDVLLTHFRGLLGALAFVPRGADFNTNNYTLHPHIRAEGVDLILNPTPQGSVSVRNGLSVGGNVSASGTLRSSGRTTTTQSSNAYFDSSGVLQEGRSAREYKVNIQDYPVDKASRIFDVAPRLWLDRTELTQGLGDEAEDFIWPYGEAGPLADEELLETKLGTLPRRVPGVVAEEVEAAGLEDFVTYEVNDDGEEVPMGVSYDRLWTLLIPIAKEQRQQIAHLQSENEQLKDRVSDLESRLEALEAAILGTGETS